MTGRASRFPQGAATSLASLSGPGCEHRLDMLREQEPVTWVPELGGWLVTSREIARRALAPGAPTTVESPQNPVAAALGVTMLSMDGPEHRRLRRPFDRSFTVREVRQRYDEIVQEEADALIDALAGRGRAELTADFAVPFSIRVAARILGIGLADVAAVERLYSDLATAMSYEAAARPAAGTEPARGELDALLGPEVERLRRTADETRAADRPGLHALTDAELLAQLRVILFGAIETIQSSVLSTVLLLLSHDDQLDVASTVPGGWVAAVDEAIRLIPPVAFIERWATTGCELGGVVVDEGDLIGISVVAANRDPGTFPEPSVYDVLRPNAARGLSFAFGPHTCLGAQLARVQSAVAVEALLTRLPGLTLVGSGPVSGFTFRRPSSLHVAWSPVEATARA